ncbi:MAG TPA: PilZ domain-containing protein [Bryobacteraceae bacterium]|nr:PilZ domain-containing protein [Bryobacteraceae bacterium]
MVIPIRAAAPRHSAVGPDPGPTGLPVPDRRQEPRFATDGSCGTAMIMGNPDSRTLCKIVDVSRAGMRIRVNTPFPVGTQLHVQWGEQFFVGDCCHQCEKGDGHILGLKLVASNYTELPGKTSFALGRLMAFCRASMGRSIEEFRSRSAPVSPIPFPRDFSS